MYNLTGIAKLSASSAEKPGRWVILLNHNLVYCNNSKARTWLWVSFSLYLRLCQNEAICAQPELLRHTDRHTFTKSRKKYVQHLITYSKKCKAVTLPPPPPPPPNTTFMLPCKWWNKRIKVCKAIGVFNCHQIQVKSAPMWKQGKQDVFKDFKNLGQTTTAMCYHS